MTDKIGTYTSVSARYDRSSLSSSVYSSQKLPARELKTLKQSVLEEVFSLNCATQPSETWRTAFSILGVVRHRYGTPGFQLTTLFAEQIPRFLQPLSACWYAAVTAKPVHRSPFIGGVVCDPRLNSFNVRSPRQDLISFRCCSF